MVKPIEWTPALVEKFWDGVAQTKLDDLSFGRVAGPAFLDLVRPYLKAGGRHLDYGAGSGHVIRLLLERGYMAAGFDPSRERQAALIERVGQGERFLGAIGPESNTRFDVVLLMEVIEHVLERDLRPMLSRINRFVEKDGHVIVSTPNNENLDYASVYCPVSDTFFHAWQHVRSFTHESLIQLLEEFGFQKVFLGLVDFSADAPVYEEYKARDRIRRFLLEKTEIGPEGLRQACKGLVESQSLVAEHILLPLQAAANALGIDRRLSLWQRIKRLRHYKKNRTRVHEALDAAISTCGTLQERIAKTMHSLPELPPELGQATHTANPIGGIDLRIGRETTIVYVGQKVREARAHRA